MADLMEKKSVVREKGWDKIESYFDLTKDELESIAPESLKHFHNMAKLGMQIEKEMNVAQRANERNFMKIAQLVSDSKEEMKGYIKEKMASYF